MSLGDSLGSLATGTNVEDAIAAYLSRMGEKPALVEDAARAQSEAIAELMFLLAAVDGEVADVELDQLKSSLAELSGAGVLAPIDTDALVPQLATRLADDGWSARMRAATETITAPDVKELAFRLAAGVAFVDDRVEAAEAAALDALGKTFGISDEAAHAMLVDVQKTLFGS
jgi:hypothetical protein